MRCGAVHKLMVEFATDGIDPARESAFRAHLATCAACRAEWAEIEEANAALATFSLPMPDDAFFERMTHAVMAATEAQPAPARRSWYMARWATASALACLVLAVGFWHSSGGPQPASAPPSTAATALAAGEPAAPAPTVETAPAPQPEAPMSRSKAPAAKPAPTPAVRVAATAPAPAPRVRHRARIEPVPLRVARAHSAAPSPAAKPSPERFRSEAVEPSVEAMAASVAADAAESVPPRAGVAGASLAMAILTTAEPSRDEVSSETLTMAAAPEVLDLGTSSFVVRLAAAPSGDGKRSVSPAVSVVGASSVLCAGEPNQP